MKIRLADLWDGPLDFKGEEPAEKYDLAATGEEQWAPVAYDFHAEILGENELLVRGSIGTAVTLPCSRCLGTITLPVRVPEFTVSMPFTTEESIDLTTGMREDILLGLPMAPSHEDVGGKCPARVEKQYHADAEKFVEERRQDAWGELDKLKERE